jgi:hypothetical protein
MIPDLNMSHAKYFKDRKGNPLEHPEATPLVQVLGRHDQAIFLPAELLTRNELETRVREQLPQWASFKPEQRRAAIEKIRNFLVPGAQRTRGAGGFLPALGIVLDDNLVKCNATVLEIPDMIIAGVPVPQRKAESWAPLVQKANFEIEAKHQNTLKVIVFHHKQVRDGAKKVFYTIRDMVNQHNSHYTFDREPAKMIEFDTDTSHWGSVERELSPTSNVPSNVFVLSFVKPREQADRAYPVVKQILGAGGKYLRESDRRTYTALSQNCHFWRIFD